MTRWQRAEPQLPTEVSVSVCSWILQIDEKSTSNLWETTNIKVDRVPEREEKVRGDRKLLKKKEVKHKFF